MDALLTEQFDRLIARLCPPEALREIKTGARAFPWAGCEDSGFLDMLVSEDDGGAGLDFSDCAPLALVLGRRGVAAPVLETMVARALWARAGQAAPGGPVHLSDLGDDPLSQRLGAICLAGQMAGAMETIVDLTRTYAGDRRQFGRPIGAFQAIQQQMAVMAEETTLTAAAARIAFARRLDEATDEVAAVAKIVAGEAAAVVASIAHAVHGAIGMSEEYGLHLHTGNLAQWRLAYGSPGFWADRLGAACLQSDLSPLDLARGLGQSRV